MEVREIHHICTLFAPLPVHCLSTSSDDTVMIQRPYSHSTAIPLQITKPSTSLHLKRKWATDIRIIIVESPSGLLSARCSLVYRLSSPVYSPTVDILTHPSSSHISLCSIRRMILETPTVHLFDCDRFIIINFYIRTPLNRRERYLTRRASPSLLTN